VRTGIAGLRRLSLGRCSRRSADPYDKADRTQRRGQGGVRPARWSRRRPSSDLA